MGVVRVQQVGRDLGHANVHRAFDASGLDKNMPFIPDFVMKEIKALGQEYVFSCTMDGVCKGALFVRYTDEQGTDDVDEEDSADEK